MAAFIGETNLVEGTVVDASGAGVRVRTALGELLSTGPARSFAHQDAKVWVSLRPECLALQSDPASPGSNAITGEIEATTYLGEIAEHRFRSGTELLRIYELNPRPLDGASRAATRTAAVASADVTLLPFDAEAR